MHDGQRVQDVWPTAFVELTRVALGRQGDHLAEHFAVHRTRLFPVVGETGVIPSVEKPERQSPVEIEEMLLLPEPKRTT